jgi:hypothetical protein
MLINFGDQNRNKDEKYLDLQTLVEAWQDLQHLISESTVLWANGIGEHRGRVPNVEHGKPALTLHM